MYFQIIRQVLDDAIPKYASSRGMSITDVDKAITGHIASTRTEHYNPDPNIDYEDFMCRLAYVFVHAGVNGTLVQLTLGLFASLRATLQRTHAGELSICTVGGGPGTELLGLCAHLKTSQFVPMRVNFTILDRVQTWSETWRVLAREVERELEASAREVTLNREFQSMDVSDPAAFLNYGNLFGEQDIIVFNYLLSENKLRFETFHETLRRLISLAKPGAHFVFIDRIEYSGSTFTADVEKMVRSSGLTNLEKQEFAGSVAEDENILAGYIKRFGNNRPRRWFRTPNAHKPTAFAIVATKPSPVSP